MYLSSWLISFRIPDEKLSVEKKKKNTWARTRFNKPVTNRSPEKNGSREKAIMKTNEPDWEKKMSRRGKANEVFAEGASMRTRTLNDGKGKTKSERQGEFLSATPGEGQIITEELQGEKKSWTHWISCWQGKASSIILYVSSGMSF